MRARLIRSAAQLRVMRGSLAGSAQSDWESSGDPAVYALRLSVERAFRDIDKVLKQLLRLPVAEERPGLPAPERNQVGAASPNRLFAERPYQLALLRIRQK